jgi:hypothetical protein
MSPSLISHSNCHHFQTFPHSDQLNPKEKPFYFPTLLFTVFLLFA